MFINSYVHRDILSLRQELINKIPELTADWTNYNESDIGVAFIELIAGVGDMLGYYLDKQALETYITDVSQRKNAKAILNAINYQMDMVVSSVTTGHFSVATNYPYNIVIPQYTQVSNLVEYDSDPVVPYATRDEVVIPAGSTEVTVPLIQGTHYTSTMTVAELLTSNKLYLIEDDIAQHSIVLKVGTGDAAIKWQEVKDALIEPEPGPKFSVHEDKFDKAYILFHSNYLNYLPTDTTTPVTIDYLTSLGKEGVVSAGSLVRLDSPIITESGINIRDRMTVTNTDASSGGSNRESVDHARVQAPREFSLMDVAVTREDFAVMAAGYEGVNKAVSFDINVDDGYYVGEPYQVRISVLPESGTASAEFLSGIKAYIDKRKITSAVTTIESAEYVDVDLSLTVHHRYPASDTDRVRRNIIDMLTNYFVPDNLEFGINVRSSNITTLVENSFDGIRYVELSSSVTTPTLDKNQVPRLNNLIVDMIRSDR